MLSLQQLFRSEVCCVLMLQGFMSHFKHSQQSSTFDLLAIPWSDHQLENAKEKNITFANFMCKRKIDELCRNKTLNHQAQTVISYFDKWCHLCNHDVGGIDTAVHNC